MSDREESNLGMVLADMGWGNNVPNPQQARVWAPALRRKIDHLQQYAEPYGLSRGVRTLLGSWGRLVERYEDVSAEVSRLKQTSTVWYTVGWANVPVASTSSVATSKVPYSGTAAMLRAILLNSQNTPVGGFGTLDMAGIDFAQPSTSSNVITYSTGAGTSGTPTQRFMDPTPFLHDKTAPWGAREVQFWVDWVFDPAAQILTSWVNPDPLNTIDVGVNYLWTSTPCSGMEYAIGRGGMWHKSLHPEVGHLMNKMSMAVFGLGGGSLPALPAHLPIPR